MRNAAGVPKGTYTFRPMPMGAGGFVTGGQIASDGAMVCQTDVHSGYVMPNGASKWAFLLLSTSMPSGEVGWSKPSNPSFADNDGETVAIAPSNSSVIYKGFNGYIWKSTNQGASFTKLSTSTFVMFTNTGNQRLHHPRAIVDPQNPSVFMFGTWEGKVVYATDGATLNTLTVSAGSTIGGNPAPHLVAVDPSSTVTGGIKQKWAYSIEGSGIYQSTTGPGGTYSLLAGSPTQPTCITYGPSGNLWAVQRGESASGNIYKKAPAGSFAKVSGVPNQEYFSIAVNPANANQIVAITGDGWPIKSEDGGATWQGPWFQTSGSTPQQSVFSTQLLWQGKNRPWSLGAVSQLWFHPTNGKIYCAQGGGVYWSTPPAWPNEWQWYEISAGIEELETDGICVPPGGVPIMSVRDFSFFRIDDENNYRNMNHIPQPVGAPTGDNSAWWVDYVGGTPSFIVGTSAFWSNSHGYSDDGGKTWHCLDETWRTTSDGLVTKQAVFTASVSGGVMTVTAVSSGTIASSNPVYYPGGKGFSIAFTGTGTGGTGTYGCSAGTPDIASCAMFQVQVTVGGQIVPTSTQDFYFFPTNDRPMESHDQGKTWALITPFAVVGAGNETGWGFSQWNLGRPASADKATGDLYAYNYGPTAHPELRGIWKRSAATGTWAQVSTGYVGGYTTGGPTLRCVPGFSGHLVVFDAGNFASPLLRSTDGGVTWAAIAGSPANVTAVGFGKAASGQTYPTVFVASKTGLDVSYDGLATFVHIADFPGGSADGIGVIEGHPDIFGKVYMGFGHRGGMIGDYNSSFTMN